MSDQLALMLRRKMLGAMLRAARTSAGKPLKDVADWMGISKSTLASYECGRKTISLPELEIFTYRLDIPLRPFLERHPLEVELFEHSDPMQGRQRRDREIGAKLRQRREQAGLSLRTLSQRSGIPSGRISAYERGGRSMPMPELESLAIALGCRAEDFLVTNGTIGDWLAARRTAERVAELPGGIQDFVCNPDNVHYLQLAKRLSELPPEKVRSVAEGLLVIAK